MHIDVVDCVRARVQSVLRRMISATIAVFVHVHIYVHTHARTHAQVRSFVQSALDGFHVSLLAYGQTGAGKTHTMLGGADEHRGRLPPSIEHTIDIDRHVCSHTHTIDIDSTAVGSLRRSRTPLI